MSKPIDVMVYYIANSPLCIQELKRYHEIIPGLIEVIFNSNSMTVINLQSRQKGGGSAMLVHVAKEALKRGIYRIELDDCSDRYNRSDNIYVKMGMEYVSAGNGPEMVGNAAKVSVYPLKTSSNNQVIRSIKL